MQVVVTANGSPHSWNSLKNKYKYKVNYITRWNTITLKFILNFVGVVVCDEFILLQKFIKLSNKLNFNQVKCAKFLKFMNAFELILKVTCCSKTKNLF